MSQLYRRSFIGRSIAAIGTAWISGSSTAAAQAQQSPSARLKALGITLPPPPAPVATYVGAVRVGNLLFVSGHGPFDVKDPTKPDTSGKVGKDLTLEQGKDAARRTGYNILASVQQTVGSIDRVVRVVKVLGMVNVAPGFTDMPQVINGFSDLMVDLYGRERGIGARSAVGMASLPQNIPVEIEAIFEVRD
jgi:enamine deaminase RidA (YjgF/YER057c/UK114 family)